jgi:hypothetical protein
VSRYRQIVGVIGPALLFSDLAHSLNIGPVKCVPRIGRDRRSLTETLRHECSRVPDRSGYGLKIPLQAPELMRLISSDSLHLERQPFQNGELIFQSHVELSSRQGPLRARYYSSDWTGGAVEAVVVADVCAGVAT